MSRPVAPPPTLMPNRLLFTGKSRGISREGDILAIVNFDNGGVIGTAQVYRWNDTTNQAVQVLTQAWFELGVVAGTAGPHLLGEGGQTWKDHVVQTAWGVDVLGPHVDLCAQDMCCLLLGHFLGDGFGGVDVLRPEQRAHRNGFVGVLGLLVVQVGSGGGGHDHVVACTCGGDAPFFPAPGHHGRP